MNNDTTISIKPLTLAKLNENTSKPTQTTSVELLRDVNLTISAELSRTKLLVKDVLALGEGSIITLKKEAGEPIDIRVNDKIIAKGQVLEIDGYYGVKITEIVC